MKTIRNLLKSKTIFGVLVIILFEWFLGVVPVQFDFLNVFEDVFNNFNLTDIYYHTTHDDEKEEKDNDIVLFNIQYHGRGTIADAINIMNEYQPKVIGIDAFFLKEKKGTTKQLMDDYKLSMAFKNVKNMVLVSEVRNYTQEEKNTFIANDSSFMQSYDSITHRWDTLQKSIPKFTEKDIAYTGFANTISEDAKEGKHTTWRKVNFIEEMKDSTLELSFAAKIVELYDSTKLVKMLKGVKPQETQEIFFKGRKNKFRTLELSDLVDSTLDKSFLKDKIIIMGYLGGVYSNDDWDDDKFFSPLNSNIIGRGEPDIYGATVHANIVSMALQEIQIQQTPPWLAYLIALILCYLNVHFFIYFYYSPTLNKWYDGLTKIIQIAQVFLLMFITIQCFSNFMIRLDFSAAYVFVVLSGDVTEVYLGFLVKKYETIRRRGFPKKIIQ